MLTQRSLSATLVALLTFTTVGCGVVGSPSTKLEAIGNTETAEQKIQRVASYKGANWMTSLVHNEQVDAIRNRATLSSNSLGQGNLKRISSFRTSAPSFNVQAMLGKRQIASNCLGEIGFDALTGTHGYMVAEDGWIYNYEAHSNLAPAPVFQIAEAAASPNETFPNARSVVFPASNGHQILFVCSASAKLYIIDLTAQTTVAVENIGGKSLAGTTTVTTDAYLGYTANPWIDFVGSPAGSWLVYVVSNNGTLHKIKYNRVTNSVDYHAQDALPGGGGALVSSRRELYATSPLVIDNYLLVGSWKRYNGANRTLDKGGFYAYNVSAFGVSSSTLPAPSFTSGTTGVASPVLSEISCETDNNLHPTVAFFTAGQTAVMADVTNAGNSLAYSNELLVNPEDPEFGDTSNILPDSSAKLTTGISGRIVMAYGTAIAFNSNALWKIDYNAPTYSATPWSAAAFAERAAHFEEPTTTVYRKSYMGYDPVTQSGSTWDTNGKYVYNTSYPCVNWDNGTTYVVDSNGNRGTSPTTATSTGTSLNVFSLNHSSPTTPPGLVSYDVLTDPTDSSTHYGGQFVSFSYVTNPLELLFTTASPLGGSSTLWSWEF